jgi:outer membrane protein assembly factor BamB
VYCFNASTGALIWNYTTGAPVVSSPAVADDKVYVGSDDNKVYCLNATTGAHIWNYTTNDKVRSSPAVADDKVYVGSWDYKIYCLNATTGAHIWNYTIGSAVRSSPAVADDKVYVGAPDDKVYCLNATTGAHIWNYTTGDNVNSSPAVVNGKVYIGSMDHNVYCLNAATGAFIWSYTTSGWITSSPAVADDKVYIGSDDNKMYCLNAATGAHIWNYTTGAEVYSSPAVAGGKVYVGSLDYKVYCLNAATGAHIWSYTTDGYVTASPAVADGVVYIGSCDNKIYAFGPPFIWHFDSLFKLNSVRMIYPSEQTPKPLDCDSAMVSDWTASAFIFTKLETVVEGIDTDAAFVDQTSGKPLGDAGSGLISFGGPIVNPVVKYAESNTTTTTDRAPIKFYQNAETLYFQLRDGTSITGANLPSSVINNNQDMFVIEVYRDGDGRNEMLCYGFGWKGTYAAGKYFDTEICPNFNSYPYSWIIVKWEDTNGNGFVNTAADGDTYTVIATGQI